MKITESALKRVIREELKSILTESAYGMTDLPADTGVRIRQLGSMRAEISYVSDDPNSPVEGGITIALSPSYPCSGAWIMQWANTSDGWGPFLYDVAIEWATWKGGGLAPDRGIVSGDARKIWDYYLNNRPDVKAHQLDDLNNTLTPDDGDNCDQASASKSTVPLIGSFLNRDFSSPSNPMSKRYTKEPSTMKALMDAGKLVQK